MLKMVVHIVTTGLQKVKVPSSDGTLSVGRTVGVKNDRTHLVFCKLSFLRAEGTHLLGYDAVLCGRQISLFQRNMLSPEEG